MTSAALAVVGSVLPPISLSDLNARASLQTRVDSKYLLDLDTWRAVVDALVGHARILDIDGQREQQYDTTYFDTAGLRCYYEHLQRRRLSFKLRTRMYLGSDLHVFEVKLRDGRGNTVKVKIDHRDRVPSVIGTTADAFFRHTIRDRYGLDVTDQFVPSLRNRYTRLTLASNTSPERTTVDHSLSFLDPADGSTRAAMHADLVLVETKSAFGNGSVDRLLWSLGCRPARLSKYVAGVASVHALPPPNRYRPAIRRALGLLTPPREVVALGVPAPVVSDEELPRAPRPPRPVRPPRPPRPPRVG